MHLFIFIYALVWHLGNCQRYAERNHLPVPVDDAYDEYFSEGYDFDDHKDIFRWNVDDFPQPQNNFRYCNRYKASYICDPDKILETDQADKLDSYVKQLYKDTPCLCQNCYGEDGGIIIGIALLKHMFQPYNEHPSKIIRSFTERLRAKWNLGKCDNDILIVVATTDRLSYTDVGKATSSYVSQQEAIRIFLENKGYLSSERFYEGLSAMLNDYYNKTRNIKRPVEDKINVGVVAGSIIGAVVLFAVILLLCLLAYRYYKNRSQKSNDSSVDKPDGETTGWRKQDIKVLFNPSIKARYHPCGTEENAQTNIKIDEEEEINTTLVTEITADTSASELLDKELGEAVEELTGSFKPSRPKYKSHETDL